MANTIKLKSSSVAGKAPTTGDLALRELAVNTTDGKLFLKKSVSGVESIVEIGAGGGGGGGAGGPIAQTAAVISENVTFATNYNGLSAGPVEVAATYAVTVPENATWMVLS
jgi:hypothetical protein